MSQPSESPSLHRNPTLPLKHPYLVRLLLTVVALGLIVIIGYAAGVKVAKIKKISTVNAEKKAQQFDPAAYVNSLWDSQIVPTIMSKAVDFQTVVSALKTDQQAAIAQYGHSESGAYNFMVKSEGKVLAVDTSSSNGTLSIDLPPYDGNADLTIQIGPVVIGFSIRDSTGITTFNSVGNQIQYGQINRVLNERAVQAALNGIDPQTLQGKTIQFYGTFTLNDLSNITVIPIQIKVVG
jgi:predicted lipoprotein